MDLVPRVLYWRFIQNYDLEIVDIWTGQQSNLNTSFLIGAF